MRPASLAHSPLTVRTLASAVVATVLTAGCAASRAGGGSDGMYTARSGAFSVPVPRMIFGTRVEEGSNEQGSWVNFASDDGSVWRIEYYSIPTDDAAMFADSAARDRFTRGFFFDVIVPDFEASHSGASVLHSDFAADSLGRAFFAVLRLPRAAAAVQMKAGELQRLDAIMHMLLFPRGSWFYVLKLVPGEMSGYDRDDPDLTPRRVLWFRGTMVFQSPN